MLSVDNRVRSFEPFWEEWRIKDVLGRGSFGQVYTIVCENFGQTYEAALKHISIPRDETELQEGYRNGSFTTEEVARSYYDQIAIKLVNEINLMYDLQGHSHIVNYQTHKIVKKSPGPGYDIFIRMEKLKPLPQFIFEKGGINRETIIKIGLDICDALKKVHENKILHRDIKPENIFYGKGEFKLGDFGVSRTLSHTVRITAAGTPNYMAPEIYRYELVNNTADIYSLGIVLYRLINNNRAPFLPSDKNIPVTSSMEEDAIAMRMRGTPLPPLPGVDNPLMQVILKACAFRPDDRYQSAMELTRALRTCIQTSIPEPVPAVLPSGNSTVIVPPTEAATPASLTAPQAPDPQASVISGKENLPPPAAGQTPLAQAQQKTTPKNAGMPMNPPASSAAPASDVQQSAPSAAPASDAQQSAPSAAPAPDVQQSAPSAAPASDVQQSAPSAAPAPDVQQLAPSAAPASDAQRPKPAPEPKPKPEKKTRRSFGIPLPSFQFKKKKKMDIAYINGAFVNVERGYKPENQNPNEWPWNGLNSSGMGDFYTTPESSNDLSGWNKGEFSIFGDGGFSNSKDDFFQSSPASSSSSGKKKKKKGFVGDLNNPDNF